MLSCKQRLLCIFCVTFSTMERIFPSLRTCFRVCMNALIILVWLQKDLEDKSVVEILFFVLFAACLLPEARFFIEKNFSL